MHLVKSFKFKKIVRSFKVYPWKESFLSLKCLPQVLGKWEKIILLALSGILVVSLGFVVLNKWLLATEAVPDHGGILREGIVGEGKDLDKHIARLLNAGLTKYDDKKNIVADMAESWEIQEDGKVYVFHLRPNFTSEDLASRIVGKGIWQDIEIATPDSSTLTFRFKQPFSPFLYTSTEPVFEYGPYLISKESKNEVELTAREDYYAGLPYIKKIIIKIYPDQESLIKAAKRNDIDSFTLPANIDFTNSRFRKLEMKLPRELTLFFNLSKKELQDINVRKALKENSPLSQTFEIRLVTSDTEKNRELAQKIADRWSQIGLKVNLDIRDNISLQKDIIPKRDYDALLYGLDYGEDPDPYPFWHSSQIKEDGKNLSNFKNTKADKLLESARQEFDFAKREEKYAEFKGILDSEIPAFVVEKETIDYYVSNKIKGPRQFIGSCETDRFIDAYSWYIETKRVKK